MGREAVNRRRRGRASKTGGEGRGRGERRGHAGLRGFRRVAGRSTRPRRGSTTTTGNGLDDLDDLVRGVLDLGGDPVARLLDRLRALGAQGHDGGGDAGAHVADHQDRDAETEEDDEDVKVLHAEPARDQAGDVHDEHAHRDEDDERAYREQEERRQRPRDRRARGFLLLGGVVLGRLGRVLLFAQAARGCPWDWNTARSPWCPWPRRRRPGSTSGTVARRGPRRAP